MTPPLLRPLVRAKLALEWALSHPALGRIAGAALRNKLTIQGCTIDVSGDLVSDAAKAAIFTGLYEKNELKFVGRHLPPDLDAVEFGSSLGVVACRIARRLSPGRRLFGVEANGRLLERARANLARNAPGIQALLVLGAIDYGSDGPDVAFTVESGHLGSHLAHPGAAGGTTVRVPRVTLQGLLSAHGIGGYSLVCDIEGAESGLILHERAALERCCFLVIELHDDPHGGPLPGIEDKRRALLDQGFVEVARSGLGGRGPVLAMSRSAPEAPSTGGQP